MRSAVQPSLGGRASGRGRVLQHALSSVLVTVSAAGLLWLVTIYSDGLRDPRYLDGWLLAACMGVQLAFHGAVSAGRLSPRGARAWRQIHIYTGYLLIPLFLSHSQVSLPDSGLEWALWTGFAVVTATGVAGAYLAWSIKAKHRTDETITLERIPALRAECARDVEATISLSDPAARQLPLPGLPHDDWIADLYATHLKSFFAGQRNHAAHLVGSKRPVKRLIDEIDSLSAYVAQHEQEKLTTIKRLVIEKDRLDRLQLYLALNRAWLLVHVPITYALVVLSIAHVLVVYAFSSGAW